METEVAKLEQRRNEQEVLLKTAVLHRVFFLLII